MAYPSRARLRATRLSYGLLTTWLALSGCSDAMKRTDDGFKPSPSGGGSDSEPRQTDGPGGPKIVKAPPMHIAANDMRSRAPMDATPSADAKKLYYTALGSSADGAPAPGVFSVDASGGEIQTLALGDELTAPVGISISPDDKMLFLADSAFHASESGKANAGAGAIVALKASGGSPSAVSGTEGYVPRGLVIAEVAHQAWLYFTGVEPESGEAGVFRTALTGGGVERIASGAPFVDPAGVAVAGDGTVYVIDALASSDGSGQASLLRVKQGKTERLVEGLGVGFPAGVATTADAGTVLVSGLDPKTRRDRVFLVDTRSGELSVITKPFSNFSQSAGLHRAHDVDTFAWADSEANGAGTVYVLSL